MIRQKHWKLIVRTSRWFSKIHVVSYVKLEVRYSLESGPSLPPLPPIQFITLAALLRTSDSAVPASEAKVPAYSAMLFLLYERAVSNV